MMNPNLNPDTSRRYSIQAWIILLEEWKEISASSERKFAIYIANELYKNNLDIPHRVIDLDRLYPIYYTNDYYPGTLVNPILQEKE